MPSQVSNITRMTVGNAELELLALDVENKRYPS